MKQDKKVKDVVKKAFFNQATLVVRREVSPLYWKEINVKIFKNGGIQMTGIRSSEMAQETITWLLHHIQTHCATVPLFDGTLNVHKFQVHLINSDFSIGAPIRRDILHTLLTNTYRLPCLYETTVYQGVKTKYFFNEAPVRPGEEGRCTCATMCEGNGTGSGVNQCKKITISPFQTGQVIIQIRDVQGWQGSNPFEVEKVKAFIKRDLDPIYQGQYEIQVVPNIVHIGWGRGVGSLGRRAPFGQTYLQTLQYRRRKALAGTAHRALRRVKRALRVRAGAPSVRC
jgi:hypothetical protein